MAGVADELLEPEDTLQVQGDAALAALTAGEIGPDVAEDLIERLRTRDWEGDVVLAEDLAAAISGVTPIGRRLPISLDELANVLEGDPLQEAGFVDLQTGEVVPGFMTDPAMVGDDSTIDVEDDPERWLGLPPPDSRSGWKDMALFAERTQPPLRDRLDRALHGRGAFRMFRDLLADADLLSDFHAFSDDRQRGRARQFLAEEGIRVVPR